MHQAFVQYLRLMAQFGIRDVPAPTAEVEASLRQAMEATQVKIDSTVQQSAPASELGSGPTNPQAGLVKETSPAPVGKSPKLDQRSHQTLPESADVETSANSTVSNQDRLQILSDEVKNCFECPDLVSNRTQTVFGVGNPDPRLCFMGEAPGAEEDVQGEPFVGAAGKLLTRIIEACKMSRDEVYILNTIKCRPPNNRNPADEECANCRSFLDAQLKILQPEFICCLGGIAAKHLLDTPLSVGRLRGKLHRYGNANVVVTYHPAYLLRNPDAKRQVWNDMKFLMKSMGQPVD